MNVTTHNASDIDSNTVTVFVHTDPSGVEHTYEGYGAEAAAGNAYVKSNEGLPTCEWRGGVRRVYRDAVVDTTPSSTQVAPWASAHHVTGVVLVSALIGFADKADEANLVIDNVERGAAGTWPVSFYDDAGFAAEVHAWSGSEGVENAYVVSLPDGTEVREFHGVKALYVNGTVIHAQGDDGQVTYDPAALRKLLGIADEPRVVAAPVVVEAPVVKARVEAPIVEAFDIPAPVVEVLPRRTVASGTVSTIAQARIREDDTLLATLGIVRPSGNFATNPGMRTAGGYVPGTAVIDLGYQNLATERRKWEQQPLVENASNDIATAIRNEQRENIQVRIGDIHMQEDGLLRVGGDVLPFEAKGFKLLASSVYGETMTGRGQVFAAAGNYLLSLPPDERAWNVNRGLARANAGDTVVLRTRVVENRRQVFATVSDGYATFDADRVLELIGKVLHGKGYRGEVGYDSGTTDLYVDATYHAPSNVQDFAAGDVFKVGFRMRSNDSAGGSINGGGAAWWNGCLNMIVIEDSQGGSFRVIHRGDMRDVVSKMQANMSKMQPVFERFAKRWGIISEAPVKSTPLWGTTYATVPAALTGIVEAGRLDVKQNPDDVVKALLAAWAKEPGDTVESIIRATTRAAHEQLVDDCIRDTWERRSGALVPVLARFAEQAHA